MSFCGKSVELSLAGFRLPVKSPAEPLKLLVPAPIAVRAPA